MDDLQLPSGRIGNAHERLVSFCRAEHAYYDAIPSADPNRIEPLDVLATVAMNSFVNDAAKVRGVHQGMAAACNHLLSALPEDADIIELERWSEPLRELLHAAVQQRGVLLPVATKVLHRKRRSLIPMLDNVVLGYYLGSDSHRTLLPRTQDKGKAADVAMTTLNLFRGDLLSARATIDTLCGMLHAEGFRLSPVRVLEVLVWIEVEPVGYYRSAPTGS